MVYDRVSLNFEEKLYGIDFDTFESENYEKEK